MLTEKRIKSTVLEGFTGWFATIQTQFLWIFSRGNPSNRVAKESALSPHLLRSLFMNYPLKQLSLYLGLLLVGGGVGVVGHRALMAPPEPVVIERPAPITPTATLSTTPTAPIPTAAPDNINFIAAAVQRVGPAVVRIDAGGAFSNPSPDPDSETQPFFRRFFRDDPPPVRPPIQRGTGSGFILSADGRLMTNAHVVEGADWVKVTLKDGRTVDGQVVGRDTVTDIAVIKIEAEDLPTVQLGQSETLTPGEWAIAIGNPLGLDNTVTVGIISALDRSSSQVGVPDKRVSFIQTDAAINPGNSGGPLLNAQGEVIGMNTAIRADAQGLGFAIPIETATRIADQLFASGSAQHPYLGIRMMTITPESRAEFNQSPNAPFTIERDQGVIVMGVINGSPAEQAGFEMGDIIVRVGETAVMTATDVQQQVERSAIGEPLAVEVERSQRTVALTVRPGAFPNNP
ncbi:trypsin-like peptidase domain-containing protein [Spirulina major CS-329]|nr:MULTISPECIES: HhoA/HhoB/HtrA family serine endopeptidase [Spirulina]MDB9497021.1 trypsin-like peptidase domain-containing protein [Spirulina subsalsa CS-330]MDB9505369.1 trypsin-like peptidase domain-containing protein [Spirulina major CS-329]